MRITCSLIAVALLGAVAVPVWAANEDGSAVAVLEGGRTLIPIRTVTEWLGADVRWHQGDNEIVITRANTTVHLRPGSTAALLNGEAIVLDEPPMVLAGVTYVPARFVVESFWAMVDYDGRSLTVQSAQGGRSMTLRVAVRDGDWLTYRGPWFDIEYPANFRPLGHDRASGSAEYDQNTMRFLAPNGSVEFYVHSPLWSGEPRWPTVWPGETIIERSTGGDGSGIERQALTWVTVAGPRDDYTRSWMEVHQPELNVKYHFGLRYDSMAAYDRWREAYMRFRNSLVQYAD